jgi:hypothetical protein
MPYKRLTALYLLVNDIFRRRFYIAEQYLDYAKFTQNRCHFSAGFQYIEVKKIIEAHQESKSTNTLVITIIPRKTSPL